MKHSAMIGFGVLLFVVTLFLWWPKPPQIRWSLLSMSPLGILAWLLVRTRKAYLVLGITILSGPVLLLFTKQLWFSIWSMSLFFVVVVSLERAVLFPRSHRHESLSFSRESLIALIRDLAIYPSVWPALIFFSQEIIHRRTIHQNWGETFYQGSIVAFLVWELACLSLIICVVSADRLGDFPKRWLRLSLIALGTSVFWGVMHSHILSVSRTLPNQLLFLPSIVWAAIRVGAPGVMTVTALSMLLPTLSPIMEGHISPTGVPPFILSFDALMTLLFTLIGLFWSLLLDHERKSLDELKSYQSRFESLLNNSPNMMAIRDLNGVYIQVNQAFARCLQLQTDEVIGQSLFDLFPADEARNIYKQDLDILNHKKPVQTEDTITFFNKTVVILSTRFPLLNAKQQTIGVCSIDTDVTDSRLRDVAKRETEARYKALVEQSLVGIFIIQDDTLIYGNPKLADMTGYTQDELFGKSIYDILDEKETSLMRSILNHRLKDKVEALHYITKIQSKTGVLIDVDIHSNLFAYRNHQALIGVIVDVSDRVAADAELRLSAKVFENSTEAILVTDGEARVLAANYAFRELMGYDLHISLTNMPLPTISSRSEAEGQLMLSALVHENHWRGEMWIERKDGEEFPIELSVAAITDQNGTINNYVIVFSDITIRHQSEERLKFLANHDPLTRLPNRSFLTFCIEDAVIHANPDYDRFAVMFIDLDRFKLINDSLGHQAGDYLLQEIAERLRIAVGKRGMIARIGGDEFTVFVQNYTHGDHLVEIAQEVLTELCHPMVIEGHEVFVTGSVGISLYPNDATDANNLLKHADVAMYRAKEYGKNNYQFFNQNMNVQTFERLLMENQFRTAIEKEEFEIYFQPKIDVQRMMVVGVECLVRWKHPERGEVPPSLFIALAEETGLIRILGTWILRQSAKEFMHLKARGLSLEHMAINLSVRQFDQQGLIQNIQNLFTETGLRPAELELEITESTIMRRPQEAENILAGLHALEVRLAIDDFGTGYSSLAYLKRFPINTIKIDKSFIDGLPDDVKNMAIIDAVLTMARGLACDVVAEGVETLEQAQCLRQSKCSMIQGYLFAKPMNLDKLIEYLENWDAQAWLSQLNSTNQVH